MNIIDRSEAIEKIATNTLNSLSHEERESQLLNWWSIDESNPDFFSLSETLQQTILANDDLPYDIQDSKYNELILLALRSAFKGVTNSFLSRELNSLNIGKYETHGKVELLEACPCCGYRTLPSLANYEVCALCSWEDDGTSELENYSPPNHMTLREAKEKFSKKTEDLPLDKWINSKTQAL